MKFNFTVVFIPVLVSLDHMTDYFPKSMLTLPKLDFHAIAISPQNSIFFTLTVEKKIFMSGFINFVGKTFSN